MEVLAIINENWHSPSFLFHLQFSYNFFESIALVCFADRFLP